jgi:hypothetical protein
MLGIHGPIQDHAANIAGKRGWQTSCRGRCRTRSPSTAIALILPPANCLTSSRRSYATLRVPMKAPMMPPSAHASDRASRSLHRVGKASFFRTVEDVRPCAADTPRPLRHDIGKAFQRRTAVPDASRIERDDVVVFSSIVDGGLDGLSPLQDQIHPGSGGTACM